MHITFSGKWAEIKSYVRMLERQGWTIDGDIDSDFVHSTVRMVSEKHSTFSDNDKRQLVHNPALGEA